MAAYCSLCGSRLTGNATTSVECTACFNMFLADIDEGRIPPGLIPHKSFTFSNWRDLRIYERDAAKAGKSRDEIRQEVLRVAQNLKESYERRVRQEEALKREIESRKSEMRSRYSY